MHTYDDDKAKAPLPQGEAAPPYSEHDDRPLPEGWISQWDPNHQQYFFVDTRANPPRSIWDHPLDDPEYRKSRGLRPESDSDSISSSSSSSSSSSDSKSEKKKEKEKKLKRESGGQSRPKSGAGGGLLEILARGLFGSGSRQSHPPPAPNMAGPPIQQGLGPYMGPMQQTPPMYAPPSYPYASRRQARWARRAEKRAYKHERRQAKRASRQERRAMKHERRMARRGYAPSPSPGMPGVPPMGPMPQMSRSPGFQSAPQMPQGPPTPGMYRDPQPGPGYPMPKY